VPARKIAFQQSKRKASTEFVGLLLLGAISLISACAHAPSKEGTLRSRIDPKALLQQACSPGQAVQQASGVAWMKAKSSDASGQFPASIQVQAAQGSVPSSLKLEVQQPFGGTAAILTIQGNDLQIEVPGKPERGRRERDTWAGIPLRWATDLFLGRIPCPDSHHAETLNRASLSIDSEDQLIVALPSDSTGRPARFVYRFDEKNGHFWPKFLRWESGSAAVDFEFGEPESETMSPLKWQAKSKQGEVKIRWRDREIVR